MVIVTFELSKLLVMSDHRNWVKPLGIWNWRPILLFIHIGNLRTIFFCFPAFDLDGGSSYILYFFIKLFQHDEASLSHFNALFFKAVNFSDCNSD